MTRDEFREAVFKRDKYHCVLCIAPAQDAHHLYERRLWPDGGYLLNNGASLCGFHHLCAEKTTRSVEEIAQAAGIKTVPLPPLLERGMRYDKWGNPFLPNGLRMRGPLWYDESVQKILHPVLPEFTKYVKYPRTPHLPWSHLSDDDFPTDKNFLSTDTEVVITEKMDGENTTIYNDYLHSRSVDSDYHPSRTWVKNFAANWQFELSNSMRITGENLYATHSIKYVTLKTYFYGFGVWEDQTCLSWDQTTEWFDLLGIEAAPLLFRGSWLDGLGWCQSWKAHEREGYVVRPAGSIHYGEFSRQVAKYVRYDHVKTDRHWLQGRTDKNELLI